MNNEQLIKDIIRWIITSKNTEMLDASDVDLVYKDYITEQVGNVAKPDACPQLCVVADNSGDILKEAVENALYATGRFTTDQCTNLSEGIVLYIKDSGLKISRQ
jgi:hypothetical protein